MSFRPLDHRHILPVSNCIPTVESKVSCIPSEQPHHRLAHHDARLWNPILRRVTRILNHLEQRAFFQIDGRTFATLVLEVSADRVDVVWEGVGREDGDEGGHSCAISVYGLEFLSIVDCVFF